MGKIIRSFLKWAGSKRRLDPVATALAALGEAAVKWVANNGNAQSSGSLFVAARAYAEAAKHGSDAE